MAAVPPLNIRRLLGPPSCGQQHVVAASTTPKTSNCGTVVVNLTGLQTSADAEEEPIYAEISEVRPHASLRLPSKDDLRPAKNCAAMVEKNPAEESAVAVNGKGPGSDGDVVVRVVVSGEEKGGGSDKSVVYGLITAKQAAKFVPCNQTLIVRH